MTPVTPRVITIPPKPERAKNKAAPRQLRVAAYCRVSTDDEEQLTSYEAQQTYYMDKIMTNKSWTMAGIFADEGITGTSARKRPEFLHMIRLCRQKKIDVILTKSISRFARNTVDCLNYIRALKALGIAVIFEKENIGVETGFGEGTISLDRRGDGIRVRYLPSILHYISKNSSNSYIWGFEEPENSLEYALAFQMATMFEKIYCRSSMIFCTSHSPAFIGLDDRDQTCLFRCYREQQYTKIVRLDQIESQQMMPEELGYIKLQQALSSDYKRRVEELEQIESQNRALMAELQQIHSPVLYTEGITDVLILETAWKRLYGDIERPFLIKSCNVLDERDGTAAGCDVLKNFLCTTQPDCPQVVIGLFDRDKQGIKSYELSANFKEIRGDWKKHKNNRAYAMLLPIPEGKELFAQYENLCIEFYFEKGDIDTRIDGKGLKLNAVPVESVFKGKRIRQEIPTEMHFHEVDKSTKRYFAETVVPTLPQSSFVHFKKLFENVLAIIDSNQPRTETPQ